MKGAVFLLSLLAGGASLKAQGDWDDMDIDHLLARERIQEVMKKASSSSSILREPDNAWLKTCSGWMAQEMCSSVFGSGIDEETAFKEDVGYIPAAASDYTIDYSEKSVTATCKWLNPQNQTYKSIFREGLGCTLITHLSEEEIRAQRVGEIFPPSPLDPSLPWPLGEGFFPELIPEDADMDCVKAASTKQFRNLITNTRAIVVVYRGQLIFEQYKRGLSKDNALLGWSATKSLTQSLLGIVSGEGGIDIFAPAPVPEWYEEEGDERQEITPDMMLRMSSGTKWVGDLGPTTECLFYSDGDCAHRCGLKPLVAEPDTLFNYNSGSSYLLSRMALDFRADKQLTPFEWPKHKLFFPIGAHSMYIEYQPNQVYLGGGYGYGKPRDWARFGLLHLRDGVWIDGTRVLPPGWSQYSRTPSKTNNGYAAHFWRSPGLDPEVFIASGFRNQNTFIFPRQELVIVRMAMPPLVGHPVFDQDEFLRDMLACFPNATSTGA